MSKKKWIWGEPGSPIAKLAVNKENATGPGGTVVAFCAGLTIVTVGTVAAGVEGFELSSLEPHADSPKQRSRNAPMPAVRRMFQIVMPIFLVGLRVFSPVPSQMILHNTLAGVINPPNE